MCVIRSAVSNAKMKTPLQYLVFFDGERNFSGVAYTCKKTAKQQKRVWIGPTMQRINLVYDPSRNHQVGARCMRRIYNKVLSSFHVFFCHQTASRVQFYTLTHAVLVVWRRFDMHTWELSIFRCFSRDTHTHRSSLGFCRAFSSSVSFSLSFTLSRGLFVCCLILCVRHMQKTIQQHLFIRFSRRLHPKIKH